MTQQQRKYAFERQPLLPLNNTARLMNRRDDQRERQDLQQLDLLAPPQLDLFVEVKLPG